LYFGVSLIGTHTAYIQHRGIITALNAFKDTKNRHQSRRLKLIIWVLN